MGNLWDEIDGKNRSPDRFRRSFGVVTDLPSHGRSRMFDFIPFPKKCRPTFMNEGRAMERADYADSPASVSTGKRL